MNETTASKGSRASKLSPSATSKRAETDSRSALRFASSIIPGEMSTPVTSKPSEARKHESVPSPQPSSSTRSPGRKRAPQSRTIAARRRIKSEGSRYSRSDQPRERALNFPAVSVLSSNFTPETHLRKLGGRASLCLAPQLRAKAVPDFPVEQVVVVIHHELIRRSV